MTERPIEVGDRVLITMDEASQIFLITGIVSQGILIVPRHEITRTSLLIPIGHQWQVYQITRLHTISFYPAELVDPEQYRQRAILTDRSPLNGLTKEQILASGFVCIMHTTTLEGLKSILKLGKIDHRLSLSRRGIPVSHGLAEAYPLEETIEHSAYNQRQFPGIYTELCSQRQILDLSKPSRGFCRLIISLALLQQQNWHLNIVDQYGNINNMTFSPRTLPDYLDQIEGLWAVKDFHGELVFHDAVPTTFIEAIIVNEPMNFEGIPTLVYSKDLNRILSQAQFIKGIDNFNLLSSASPQYCYTGVQGNIPEEEVTPEMVVSFYSSVNPWTSEYTPVVKRIIQEVEDEYVWQKRLDNCGINEKYSPPRKAELFERIQDRMEKIYFEDSPRTPVKEKNWPPWRYTPRYYRNVIDAYRQ